MKLYTINYMEAKCKTKRTYCLQFTDIYEAIGERREKSNLFI